MSSWKSRFLLMLAALALVLGFLPGAQAAYVYDLTADWSNANNPNGVWAYRKATTNLPSIDNWGGVPGQKAWAYTTSGVGHIPVWLKTIQASGLLYAGDVAVHSWDSYNGGAFGEPNATWTSPMSGPATISGWACIAAYNGRSTDFFLYLNGVELDRETISDAGPYTRLNPYTFSFVQNVQAGDVVMVRTQRSAGYSPGDFIGVNLHLEVVPLPPAAWLLGSGLAGLFLLRRRRG